MKTYVYKKPFSRIFIVDLLVIIIIIYNLFITAGTMQMSVARMDNGLNSFGVFIQ